MKARASGVLVLLVLSGFPPLSATGPQTDDAVATLTALENRWLAAEDDPGALEPVLADDFIHVLPAGFVTKEEQLSFMREHPRGRSGSRHFEDLRVRVYGTAGVVNGVVVATSAEGKVGRTLFTDVFAYRGGRWQAVNAQELPLP